MIEVRFQNPYGDCEWRSQWFDSLDFAERMVDFYLSCGSPAYVTHLAYIAPLEDDVLIIG